MNSVVEKEMLIFYSGDCLVNFGESDCCFITIKMTMMMSDDDDDDDDDDSE